jgi:hypothetical protein
MIKLFLTAIALVAGLYLVDKYFLWLEEKGWIYWRKKKPTVTGGIGNTLQELNIFLNPSAKHMIEAKQHQTKKSDQSGGVSGDLLKLLLIANNQYIKNRQNSSTILKYSLLCLSQGT